MQAGQAFWSARRHISKQHCTSLILWCVCVGRWRLSVLSVLLLTKILLCQRQQFMQIRRSSFLLASLSFTKISVSVSLCMCICCACVRVCWGVVCAYVCNKVEGSVRGMGLWEGTAPSKSKRKKEERSKRVHKSAPPNPSEGIKNRLAISTTSGSWEVEWIGQLGHSEYPVLRKEHQGTRVCLPEYRRFWQHSCYFWTGTTWIIFGTVISSERIAFFKKKKKGGEGEEKKGRVRGGETAYVTIVKWVQTTKPLRSCSQAWAHTLPGGQSYSKLGCICFESNFKGLINQDNRI